MCNYCVKNMSNNLKTWFQIKKMIQNNSSETNLTYFKIKNFQNGEIIPHLYIIGLERGLYK